MLAVFAAVLMVLGPLLPAFAATSKSHHYLEICTAQGLIKVAVDAAFNPLPDHTPPDHTPPDNGAGHGDTHCAACLLPKAADATLPRFDAFPAVQLSARAVVWDAFRTDIYTDPRHTDYGARDPPASL